MRLSSLSLISEAQAQETSASTAPAADAGAAGAAPPPMSPLASLLPMLLIFAVFYFLLIRPQQRKLKEHQKMVEGVRRGDKVVTAGGILGLVTKVENDIVHVEIAPNTRVRIMKSTLTDIVSRTGVSEPANDKTPSSKEDESTANDN